MAKVNFLYSDQPEPHIGITRKLLETYPELHNYMGKRNAWTALIAVVMVAIQTSIGAIVAESSFWLVLPLAWIVGTTINHTFIAIVHEAAHNLAFKKSYLNKWMGILVNMPMIIPSSIQFQKYHLRHHQYQGQYYRDADIPDQWEIEWVRNITWRKIVWMFLYPLWQSLRPARVKDVKFLDKWFIINFVSCLVYSVAVVQLWGWMSFAYLFLSFWLCFGLSVPGGRLVQEHYVLSPPQETYSYYGLMTYPSLHVGYHNEHHDFPYVSWNYLPKIRKIASEHYDSLISYQSWGLLMLRFLFDPSISLHMRMTRDAASERKRKQAAVETEVAPEPERFPLNSIPSKADQISVLKSL